MKNLLSIRKFARFAQLGALMGVMLLALAACGGATLPSMDMSTMPPESTPAAEPTTPAAAPADGGATGSAVEVAATLREWGLDLSQTEVAAGTIRFAVSNTGRMPHNLTIRDAAGTILGATPNFPAGDSPVALEVTLPPGTYTVYCSLPGHAAQGQQNTLVVK
jgi:plastocyanin